MCGRPCCPAAGRSGTCRARTRRAVDSGSEVLAKDDPNHAVIAKWQVKRDVPESCFLTVLSKILSQKFFDVLRRLSQVIEMS